MIHGTTFSIQAQYLKGFMRFQKKCPLTGKVKGKQRQHLNYNNEIFWYHLQKHSRNTSFEVHFDVAEIVDTFKQLDMTKQPLQLELNM